MLFEELVKDNKVTFLDEVKIISKKLKIDPNNLMFAMWIETARTFSPSIRNKVSGATGLIQFMPSTARSLGTTTDLLAKMTNVEQLDYVYKYLAPYAGKMNDWLDTYLAIFYPALMGKPDSTAIKREIVARQNPLFDLNKDLIIHKYEIRTALRNTMPEAAKKLLK